LKPCFSASLDSTAAFISNKTHDKTRIAYPGSKSALQLQSSVRTYIFREHGLEACSKARGVPVPAVMMHIAVLHPFCYSNCIL